MGVEEAMDLGVDEDAMDMDTGEDEDYEPMPVKPAESDTRL